MIIKTDVQDIKIDINKPIDISLPITADEKNPVAWYLSIPKIAPVVTGDFIGSVASGTSSTNFNTIEFNPHAHGTHTECLGHITKNHYSINQTLKRFFFLAVLVSITLESENEDQIITLENLKKALSENASEAVIIRTLPNLSEKKHKNYSHTNPPYLHERAAAYLCEIGVKHLLIDLPSVDKEKDEGKLLAHKAFWNVRNIEKVNADARFDATITELVFIPDEVADGNYLLNLQIASFENDASPSKPVLYAVENI